MTKRGNFSFLKIGLDPKGRTFTGGLTPTAVLRKQWAARLLYKRDVFTK